MTNNERLKGIEQRLLAIRKGKAAICWKIAEEEAVSRQKRCHQECLLVPLDWEEAQLCIERDEINMRNRGEI